MNLFRIFTANQKWELEEKKPLKGRIILLPAIHYHQFKAVAFAVLQKGESSTCPPQLPAWLRTNN